MSEPAPRRRPRISLLSLLLLMALAASGVTNAILLRELGPLREENRRMRSEVGALTIKDASKVHAIALDPKAVEGYEWAWRIYVPPGRTATFRPSYSWPTTPGDAGSGGSSRLPVVGPGEHVARIVLKAGSGNRYHRRISFGGSTTSGGTQLPSDSGGMSVKASAGELTRDQTAVLDGQPSFTLLEATLRPKSWPGANGEPVMKIEAVLEVQ